MDLLRALRFGVQRQELTCIAYCRAEAARNCPCGRKKHFCTVGFLCVLIVSLDIGLKFDKLTQRRAQLVALPAIAACRLDL